MPPQTENNHLQTAAEDVDLDVLDDIIGYHLRRAQLKYYKGFAQQIKRPKVSPTQFAILVLIEKNPGIPQILLGQVLSMAKPAIMTIINKLEKRGLVVRRRSDQDGRVRALYLTAQGQRGITELRARVQEIEDAELKNLSQQEKRQLKRLLSKLRMP